MTCDQARELISAQADGELDPADAAGLDAHLATCEACTAFAADMRALDQSFRLHAAAELSTIPEPKLTLADSIRAASILRWILFVIGATLAVLNLSNLVFDADAIDRHLSRHDAVFGTALGIGMLSVAARPHRAIGLVPITSTIAALMAIVAVADIVGDRRSMLAEAVHVLEFAGLVCLWVISGGPSRLRSHMSRLMPMRSSVPSWPNP